MSQFGDYNSRRLFVSPIVFSFALDPTAEAPLARGLTDISVTDKSACLREFYRCTAAVGGYKSHVCARISHFDREASHFENTPVPPVINPISTCGGYLPFPRFGFNFLLSACLACVSGVFFTAKTG